MVGRSGLSSQEETVEFDGEVEVGVGWVVRWKDTLHRGHWAS